ncbi:MAG: hypothetical protein H6835_05690 [Planctomycetes bacterium]|nr:hypothetical protein [Planctomycetota bacterium]
MMRQTLTVLFVLLWALLPALRAQELSSDEFRRDFNKGLELSDEKLQDKAMKRGSSRAISYYEELWWGVRNGEQTTRSKCDALMASWQRCFGDAVTIDKIQRWTDGCSNDHYEVIRKVRTEANRAWNRYLDPISKGQDREAFRSVVDGFKQLAKTCEEVAHYYEASEMWGLASVAMNAMPQKTLEDKEEVVFLVEQQLAARDNWGFTFDSHYITGREFVKAQKVALEEAKKNADKREAEGYGADAKGLEALVMPNVPAAVHELSYATVKDWQKDMGYGPRSGPLPLFWWQGSMTQIGTNRKLDWFRAANVYLHRTGASKFAIGLDAATADGATEVEASARPKPTEFFLDADKKMPYAMFFWQGGEREMTGVAECNYSPSTDVANLYYNSAASWEATADKETFVFYDDDCSGAPGRADPFEGEFKMHLLGDAGGNGVAAPLLDSMRLGKGPRVPFSAFVKLASGWHHMELKARDSVSLRPLNPEYVKTGKLKLAWSGPKPTAPAQLVVRGRGDFAAAMFDIAGGKEVEMPAGDYDLLFGRIVAGKGARMQGACIYAGEDQKPILVEPGKTTVVEMGAPFRVEFRRDGDKNASIDGLSIYVADKSGAKITELQGIGLHCAVFACKDDTGKGRKEVGEFLPMTDGNLAGAASSQYPNVGFQVACFPMPKGYQKGELVLKCDMPADGMKLGLEAKKPPLFGKLDISWK